MDKQKKEQKIKFPLTILRPVGNFLAREAKRLEIRKKALSQEDPFNDVSRITDNASPDSDAAEQFGHQKVKASQGYLDRRIIQIKKALSRLKIGKYGICENCGKMIDTDRLMVMPESTLCAKCAQDKER